MSKVKGEYIVCPKCFAKVTVCSDFDHWFFLCLGRKCGWESHRFDKGFNPDRVTQKEVFK